MKAERSKILADIAKQQNLQGILVYSPLWRKENFRYLTGTNFFGPFSMVFYNAEKGKITLIFSSSWDKALAQKNLKGIDEYILLTEDISDIPNLLQKNGVKKLGVVGLGLLTYKLYEALSQANVEISSVDTNMERYRYVKSPEEVELLHKAVSLADQGFTVFCESAAQGLKDYQIVANVEHYIKTHGAEDNFMLMAVGGKDVRGMTPAQGRIAQKGEMLRTEITPCYKGWWAQICRTVVVGKANPDQKKAAQIYWEAEEAGLNVIKPGVNIADVARAENDVFRKYGYGEYTTFKYTRVRGHGQGMFLDEVPTVNEDVDVILEEGMVLVVHPNTFNPLCGYMVLGDPVVVTSTGYKMLSTTERKLFEL